MLLLIFQGNFFNRSRRSKGGSGHGAHRPPGGSTSSSGSGGSVRSASYVTSTPNSRQSAPNLSSMASTGVGVAALPSGGHPMMLKTGPTVTQNHPMNHKTVTSPSAAIDLDFNIDTSQNLGCNDLTAEIDLSDENMENLGVTPIQDSHEDTPMFCTPRTNSRIVRIISKQSNV